MKKVAQPLDSESPPKSMKSSKKISHEKQRKPLKKNATELLLTDVLVRAALAEKSTGLYFPIFETMNLAAAREIARYVWYVDLSDIRSMTDEVYRALVRAIPHQGDFMDYSASGMNLSGLLTFP